MASSDHVLAYTGDTGPSGQVLDLARDADLFLAEASHVDRVPDDMAGLLSTAHDAGAYAASAGVRSLLLTHLLPTSDSEASLDRARSAFGGDVEVARPGFQVDVGER